MGKRKRIRRYLVRMAWHVDKLTAGQKAWYRNALQLFDALTLDGTIRS
jgi:hypothetical protein